MFIQHRLNKLWDEALLSAALWFLKEELGVTTIWYHTFATGNKLKRIKYTPPPRSLYSKLPRRFCFTETSEHPDFMLHDKSFRRVIKRIDSPSVSGKRHQSKRQLDDEIDEYYDQQALSQRRDNNSKNPQKERDDSAPSTTDFMFFAHAQFSTTALPSFYSRLAHDLHAQSIH